MAVRILKGIGHANVDVAERVCDLASGRVEDIQKVENDEDDRRLIAGVKAGKTGGCGRVCPSRVERNWMPRFHADAVDSTQRRLRADRVGV